jgi:gamma-glutamylcyclotransferase (GGCT)/AIG2-like uncharacterized protein YtfP
MWMTERFFVYGTLAPGRPNAHVLADVPGRREPATARGQLLQHGWGAEVGFPGIVLDENGPEVHGMLFSSDELRKHWERLDQFEGKGYMRVLTPVSVANGETAQAYIYVLAGSSAASNAGPSA